MTTISKRIGKHLKAARLGAGMTQQALASKAGVSVVHISRLERAVADQPRRAELESVAAALGLSTDDLMGLADEIDDDQDEPEAADSFQAELAHRYGPENAAFVDEVVRVIKDFPAREAAFVRNMLIGAVHGAKSPWRNSNNGARDIGDLVRA